MALYACIVRSTVLNHSLRWWNHCPIAQISRPTPSSSITDPCALRGISCCVDEVAADHVGADCVIHFGHACLSPTSRLPVHYVFVDLPLDVSSAADALCPALPADRTLVVLTDVRYQHALGEQRPATRPGEGAGMRMQMLSDFRATVTAVIAW